MVRHVTLLVMPASQMSGRRVMARTAAGRAKQAVAPTARD